MQSQMSDSEDRLASSLHLDWQVHSLQALVEFIAKRLTLKTTWQVDSLQGLVESIAKC